MLGHLATGMPTPSGMTDCCVWLARADSAAANWLWIHGTKDGRSVAFALSYFGGPGLTGILITVGLVLIWRRRWRALAALAITCGVGAVLNVVLKAAFQRSRPAFPGHAPVGWSFPSAHAMNSFVAYGFLAMWAIRTWPQWRTPIALSAVALVAAIGFARLYLGMHYSSDILGGYAAGLVWLVICTLGLRLGERDHDRKHSLDRT